MQRHRTPKRAFTLIEVLVVVAMVFFLAASIVMPCSSGKARAQRIACLSNLKQTGLGFRLYSNDHQDRFPWQVPMTTGTLEYALSPQVCRHFLAASNEINTPKVLQCPTDKTKTRVADWGHFANTNLSYFVNVASADSPQSILTGDRNITGGTPSNSFLRTFTSTSVVSWTKELHFGAGNLGLADGSAQQAAGGSNIIGAARLAIP